MSPILESLNAFSAAGLTSVLNTLWVALAVAAVIWLALRLMPRVNAATRHAVWWAALALIGIMPLATLLPRSVPAVPSLARTETRMQAQPQPQPSAARPLTVIGADAPRRPITPAPMRAASSRADGANRLRIPLEFHPGSWPSRLLFLWMAASLFLIGRIVWSYIHLRGLRNRCRPASAELAMRFEQRLGVSGASRVPRLLVSDEVISPLAAGFLHPVVILPDLLVEEIAGPELDCVLLHELGHLARRDNWTNLAARIASAFFVFHPVAAWVLRRIKREREIACDDWVVSATGSADRYPATLARVFEFCTTRRRELLATEMASRSSNFGERIEVLLRPRFSLSPGASLPRVSFCVAAGLALLSFGVRMPGWIAFAKDSTVAAASGRAVPRSESSAAGIALAPETSRIGAPSNGITPAHRADSQATSAGTSADEDKTWRHQWKITRRGSSSSTVELSLISRNDDGNDRMNTQDVSLSSLEGFSLSALDHDGPVKFEYVRDAGRIVCEGRVSGGRASGPFTVVLNSSFVSALQKMGYAAPRDDESFSLVTSDVTLNYAQAVRDTGLTSSISDLIGLRDHGVSSDYVRAVRQEGFTNLTAPDISELRDHGVEPKYLKAIKAADPNLSIEAIDSLFDHGVKPDYYKSMKAAAPQLQIEQIDSLFDHGVEPDTYKGYAANDPKLSIEEINSLRDHGVKDDYYRSVKLIDAALSIEQVDSLFDHGVKPEYYRGMKSAGSALSIEQIDSLYDHGVEPDTYKGFAVADSRLSVSQISSLRDHGVEPSFYQGTKAVDSGLSIEEINRLRDHGVEPEYLKEIRALPDRFSISDVSVLRDHGITAKYIRNLHDMGMKSMTADQIVHLHDSD